MLGVPGAARGPARGPARPGAVPQTRAMRHPLVAWEGPIPSSPEEAVATHDQLIARYPRRDVAATGPGSAKPADGAESIWPEGTLPPPLPPTQAVALFLADLAERWPDLTDIDGDPSPVIDAPPNEIGVGPVVHLAVIEEHRRELVPSLVGRARIHGLVVFDPRERRVLTDGVDAPTDSSSPAAAPSTPIATFEPGAGSPRDTVIAGLAARGFVRDGTRFVRDGGGGFTLIVDPGDLWAGLLASAPWVGLRHEGVERLLVELVGGEPAEAGQSATVTLTVRVEEGSGTPGNAPVTADAALAAIDEGLRTLTACSSLDRLAELHERLGPGSMSHVTLAAIHFLSGDERGACRRLAEGERVDCAREDLVAARFRVFERNLLARMSGRAPAELARQREIVAAGESRRTSPKLLGRLFGRGSR
jgi:hypothetical protein